MRFVRDILRNCYWGQALAVSKGIITDGRDALWDSNRSKICTIIERLIIDRRDIALNNYWGKMRAISECFKYW